MIFLRQSSTPDEFQTDQPLSLLVQFPDQVAVDFKTTSKSNASQDQRYPQLLESLMSVGIPAGTSVGVCETVSTRCQQQGHECHKLTLDKHCPRIPIAS